MQSKIQNPGHDGERGDLVARSLGEAKWILLIWLGSFVWTLVYCGYFGYQSVNPETLETVMGMPDWVFWGVAVPWVLTSLASIAFAIFGIHDEPLTTQLNVSVNEATDTEALTND